MFGSMTSKMKYPQRFISTNYSASQEEEKSEDHSHQHHQQHDHHDDHQSRARRNPKSSSSSASASPLEKLEANIDKWMKKFIKLIHPDLLHNHPTEKSVNEKSFQLLNSFVDYYESISEGKPMQPNNNKKSEDLEFYLRISSKGANNKDHEQEFKKITFQLKLLPAGRPLRDYRAHLKASLLTLFSVAGIEGVPDLKTLGNMNILSGVLSGPVSSIGRFLRTHAEAAKERITDRMVLERSLGLASS